jgi:hypothetical protein
VGALICLAWIPLVVLAGTLVTPRLTPAIRVRLLGRTGPAFAVLAILLAVPLALAMLGGWQLRDPDDEQSGWFLPITMVVLIGGPAATVSGIVWQRARRLARLDQRVRGPRLPAPGYARPAPLPALPAPLPGQTAPLRVHRVDRGLRRARTALFTLAFCAYLLARVFQVQSLGSSVVDPPALMLLLIVLPLMAGLVLVMVLRFRERASGSRSTGDLGAVARAAGWVLTRNDTDRVPAEFPAAPFMRQLSHRNPVEHKVVVDGATGGQPWWAVEQRGLVKLGAYSHQQSRTVVVTALAGAALPSVSVAGRDTVGVLDWFRDCIRLESDDLNQRLLVTATRGSEAVAWAVMNPRMMEHVLAHLPDGATLAFGGNTVSVVLPRALRTGDLATVPTFLLGAAALVPSSLLRATRT